jgi:hypothetical protein
MGFLKDLNLKKPGAAKPADEKKDDKKPLPGLLPPLPSEPMPLKTVLAPSLSIEVEAHPSEPMPLKTVFAPSLSIEVEAHQPSGARELNFEDFTTEHDKPQIGAPSVDAGEAGHSAETPKAMVNPSSKTKYRERLTAGRFISIVAGISSWFLIGTCGWYGGGTYDRKSGTLTSGVQVERTVARMSELDTGLQQMRPAKAPAGKNAAKPAEEKGRTAEACTEAKGLSSKIESYIGPDAIPALVCAHADVHFPAITKTCGTRMEYVKVRSLCSLVAPAFGAGLNNSSVEPEAKASSVGPDSNDAELRKTTQKIRLWSAGAFMLIGLYRALKEICIHLTRKAGPE